MGNAKRFFSLGFIILVAFVLIGWRLFHVGYLRHTYYQALKEQQIVFQNDASSRGSILIKDLPSNNLILSAVSEKEYKIELSKKKPVQIDRVLNLLSGIVSFDVDRVLNDFLDSSKSKVVIIGGLNQDQISKIRSLGLDSLNIIASPKRIYPLGSLAAHVFGFLGFQGQDRVGQYGIEAQYEDLLSGKNSSKNSSDPSDKIQNANLILTIDKNIQSYVEEVMNEIYKKWEASGASVIVQDPGSGAILAMAATPSFDPNNYSTSPTSRFINPTVQEVFEPGSSFKPITMAAGLDLGEITPKTTYVDPGMVRIGSYTITNFNGKNFGVQTMTQVLEKSLNTGAIFVERKIGDENFLSYVERFGFGRKTGIDLFGETSGDIQNLYSKRPVNFATAAFGQGVAVTPIQLITAYSAIANGGKLMKPYLVDKIIFSDGKEEIAKSSIVGRPISETTALTLQQMLVSAVDNGFDKARVKGYDVAGKTGTAQIPDGKGGYSDEFIHNFLGFAPAYNAKFTVLLKLDRPKGIKFSSDSLSPPFAKISRFLVNYFSVSPTRPN
ncbi:MAG: penicillin-binding protein 2 [Parcubacteria group bacterium]|nr:penicillin-binding protein 2 [Parcubacteria group bacterium]